MKTLFLSLSSAPSKEDSPLHFSHSAIRHRFFKLTREFGLLSLYSLQRNNSYVVNTCFFSFFSFSVFDFDKTLG